MFQQKVIFFTALALLVSPDLSAAKPPYLEAWGTVSTEPKLQIISATQERLEANFLSPTTGIHILSQVHGDGELAHVSVTSKNGETIFAVDRPIADSSQSLLTLAGSEFLMVSETLDNGESEYAITEAYSPQVRNAMKQRILSKPLLQSLDSENVKISGRNAIGDLLTRPEVQLIAKAATALGNTGLYGRENQPAMAFYATALRFATISGEPQDRNTYQGAAVRRYKRWLPSTYCSNSDSYCLSCPLGSNCNGLCGPGCSCWWWICNDCCYNVGCYLHDVYGCSGGQDSLQCWLTAPASLICS